MGTKFEGQFKVRDERDVNARFAARGAESQKCLQHSGKLAIVKFDLPSGFVER
ncbi:hypothetical protein [Bradyrhizobium roseum]|uniref:hypothetical protein n=1 Tax=Bradyrhizobium roseum TaxID=3056648 RepID=UPI00263622CA|nr:hypothetical protein [Bradyrhizobium roseus]WKA31431.1 hypothetical protein QUH67_15260 [Bradyrhizobium roseus]